MHDEDLLARIAARLGPRAIVTGADKQPYETGARHGGGQAHAVVLPASATELAWVVQELVAAGVKLLAQGAGTGLVAAAVPADDGQAWIVSTQRLRDVIDIDPVNRSATVAAGYRLSDLNRAAAEHGLMFPIDLGADPSIGGMVATNTGGARLVRYGGVRENLLDVQAVLAEPAGRVVGGSRGLRKNNTGLSWPQLLCGTFGAFGFISRATLKLHAVQRQSATALVAVRSTAAAVQLLCEFEHEFGEMVSAFEGISADAMDAVRQHGLVRPPFAETPAYAVLLEISSAIPRSGGVDLEALLVDWLAARMENGIVEDAVAEKSARLWRIRHSISEAVQALGRLVAFDLSVPRSRFASFLERARTLVKELVPEARVCDFGHLGDGGVHLNIVVPADLSPDAVVGLRDEIYELTVTGFGGSFSAEHGLGPYNQRWYLRFAEPAVRDWACVLHGHFDPRGLLGRVRLD